MLFRSELVPSGDDGFGEHAAVVDGSQQPTKGDLNKLYSAMQYQHSKPLETYKALGSTNLAQLPLGQNVYLALCAGEPYLFQVSEGGAH